jgi:hypothetical protein
VWTNGRQNKPSERILVTVDPQTQSSAKTNMRYGNDASSLEDVVEIKEDLIVQVVLDLQAVRG